MESQSSVKSAVGDPGIDFGQTPSYLQFVVHSYHYFFDNFAAMKNYSLANDFTSDFKLCYERITFIDLSLIVGLTIVWTLARMMATRYVFKVMHSTDYLTFDTLSQPIVMDSHEFVVKHNNGFKLIYATNCEAIPMMKQ